MCTSLLRVECLSHEMHTYRVLFYNNSSEHTKHVARNVCQNSRGANRTGEGRVKFADRARERANVSGQSVHLACVCLCVYVCVHLCEWRSVRDRLISDRNLHVSATFAKAADPSIRRMNIQCEREIVENRAYASFINLTNNIPRD